MVAVDGYIYGFDVRAKYPDVKISIERITPAIARNMLEHNTHNRGMKRTNFASAMENGEWILTGSSIVFDENGILVDGQNRLNACATSGVSFDTIVVRGIPMSAQTVIDVGTRRSVADQLKLAGIPQPTLVQSIGIALMLSDMHGIENGMVWSRGYTRNVTTTALTSFCLNSYEHRIKPLVSPVRRVSTKFSCPSGPLGVIFEKFSERPDDFSFFVDDLCADYSSRRPIGLLANELLKSKTSKDGKLSNTTIAAYIIKAWNAYLRGEEPKFLRFNYGGAHPEKFPSIYMGDDAA